MAKQQPKKFQPQKKQSQRPAAAVVPALPPPSVISPLSSFRNQAFLIIFIGIVIYFNSIVSAWDVKKYAPAEPIPAADTINKKKIIFELGGTKYRILPTLNKYALDDDIVMRLNDYVQQGFSGLGKIMSTDSYDSFFKSMGSAGELEGGRYRPLSIVTFAIEQQLFGECYGNRFIEVKDSIAELSKNPMANAMIVNKLLVSKVQLESSISKTHEDIAMIRHIISVLLYILSAVILLWLLRDYIFKYAGLKFIHHTDIAFLSALMFLVHPIHTEVVANVKSRDEILSFLFIILTLIFVFKYFEAIYNRKENKSTSSAKNIVSAVASWFIPGLGQIIKGHYKKGLLFMLGAPAIFFCLLFIMDSAFGLAQTCFILFFPLYFAIWIWNITDAYNSNNEEILIPLYIKFLSVSLIFFNLALLSKEWGITLVPLIPLALYIFRKCSIWDSIKWSLPFFAIAFFYLALRTDFVGVGKQGEITEVLNNPFVFATPIQKLATEIFVLIKYIRLLIFPHPLSADYSWQTIPYSSFGDLSVWFSFFVHGVIIYYFFKLLGKRHWIAFAIAFYASHLLLVSNLLMPIGATMGERLIYHSSLGFVMIASFGLLTLLHKLKLEGNSRKFAFSILALAVVVPMGFKTIERNPNWETDNILFMHDAWVVPNSVLANGNAGKAFIEGAQKDTAARSALLDSAIYHLEKSVSIHPKYVNGYLNLGLAFFQKKDLDKAEHYWGLARKYFPTHPFFRQSYDPALAGAFVERARNEAKGGNVPKAIEYLTRALKYDNTNTETWYHYGGANLSVGNIKEAQRGWSKCLELNPNHTGAKNELAALSARLKNPQGAVVPPVQPGMPLNK